MFLFENRVNCTANNCVVCHFIYVIIEDWIEIQL